MAKIDLKMTIDYDEQTKTICKYDIADEYTLGEIAVIVAAFKHILMDWGYITKRKEE